jgi:TonB-dependent SusC/RagA subfamily outer membrane receptor
MHSRTGITGTTGVGRALVALAALLTVTACGGKRADPAPDPAASDSTAAKGGRPSSDQVPVGYGTQDRHDMAVAVSSISSDEVERFRVTRVEELLQGRVPGVDVKRKANGEISVRIRGAGNLTGGGEPLWVLDGMPLSPSLGLSALASISPQDVERIEVLKDAGSTAIYGTQGANGVILIRTKHER